VLLAPSSGALRLFERQLRLDIGAHSSVRVPSVATVPTAPFIGEMQPAPVLQGALSATTLGPTRKILILAALTEELETASSPENASAIIGHILGAAAAKGLDAVALDSNPDDGVRPAGLLYGVTPLVTGAGAGLDAIVADIGAMAAAMAAANVDPESMTIVAAPRQATTLRLLAGPKFTNEIFGTTGLADGTVIGFARGAVASSFEGTPVVETAKGVTVHMSDTPTAVVSGTPTHSMFQMGQVGLRLRQRGSWAVVAPGGVQRVNNVNW
jgi:hypothetical protein